MKTLSFYAFSTRVSIYEGFSWGQQRANNKEWDIPARKGLELKQKTKKVGFWKELTICIAIVCESGPYRLSR